MLRRLHATQPEAFAFTPANLAWATAQITKYPEGRQASAIIPLLFRAQEQEGWLSRPAIEAVAEMLGMPYMRALEVATFYFMFQLQPTGSVAHIQVCGTTSCMICGAEDLISVCKRKISAQPHALSADGKFSWEEVECLGACANAPMAQIGKDYYEDLTEAGLEGLIDAMASGATPRPGSQSGRFGSEPAAGLTSCAETLGAKEAANSSVARSLAVGDGIKRITGGEVPLRAPWQAGGQLGPIGSMGLRPLTAVQQAAKEAVAKAEKEAAAKREAETAAAAAKEAAAKAEAEAAAKAAAAKAQAEAEAAAKLEAAKRVAAAKEAAAKAAAEKAAAEKAAAEKAAAEQAAAEKAASEAQAALVAPATDAPEPDALKPDSRKAPGPVVVELAAPEAAPQAPHAPVLVVLAEAEPVAAPGAQADAPEAETAPEVPEAPAAQAPKSVAQNFVDLADGEGTKPEGIEAPRDGKGDDLQKIEGIGPVLARLCHDLGIFHYDQIAAWGAAEVAWMDTNLKGFRGRVSRDRWVAQARLIGAEGLDRFLERAKTNEY